jgi:ABC-type taurine transport system ATPase subunit
MEISFNNTNYIYNKNSSIKNKVLDNINVKFNEGEITGIIGRSGSGKTTMAELMNALLFPLVLSKYEPILIVPSEGNSRAFISSAIVVLPLPLLPIIPVISPSLNFTFILSRTLFLIDEFLLYI